MSDDIATIAAEVMEAAEKTAARPWVAGRRGCIVDACLCHVISSIGPILAAWALRVIAAAERVRNVDASAMDDLFATIGGVE